MNQRILAIITGVLLTISTGWSASVLKMDIDDLTQRSDIAIVGKVQSISHANESGRYPETLFRVQILETFYGEGVSNEVIICLPGGPAGNGLTTYVPGMPKFKVDEKVALFLVLDEDRGVAVPTGLEQGVFRVKVHPETEEEYVVNQTVDIKMNSIGSSEGDGKANGPSLTEFGKNVKQKAEKLKQKK